jgi:hypothetical protein
MAGCAVAVVRIETGVPRGRCAVAAEAEICDAVMGQHASIGGSMHVVTGGAAFNAGRFMLEHERAFLVGMTAEAGFMLETAQAFAGSRLMGIVAGGTLHDAFLESVPLVQLELRENVSMTHGTAFVGFRLEQVLLGRGGMYGMASRAVQRRLAVGAGQVA